MNPRADAAPRSHDERIVMLLRRRRYMFLQVSDTQTLDIVRFLRGEIARKRDSEMTMLCPVSGDALRLTGDELALILELPSNTWIELEIAACSRERKLAQLVDLADRGLVVSSPPCPKWHSLDEDECLLDSMQWHDLGAVYQAHTQWRYVEGDATTAEWRPDVENVGLKQLQKRVGEAPSHFMRRPDAANQIPLRVPELNGEFFGALLARRTTRTFVHEKALPLGVLETMLYAVFGAQGIRNLGDRVFALRRTSPSAGALHPIEAYVLALHVESLPSGIYHYEIGAHALSELEQIEVAEAHALACLFTAGQVHLANAHALVVHVARMDRTFWKYGHHRKAYRAVLMDSAHLSQTFYLTAAHLGLGAFFTSAINDADIAKRLRLPPLREAAIGINGIGIGDFDRDEHQLRPEPYQPAI